MAASLLFVGCTIAGACDRWGVPLYAGAVIGYLGLRILLKVYMAVARPGRTIPTINPLRWILVRETGSEYIVDGWTVGRGTTWSRRYQKCVGIDAGDMARIARLPEVRRLFFASYIVIAERDGATIRLRDPLRTDSIIWYPPHYTEVALPENVSAQQADQYAAGR
jgi:hypothetical protein